MRSAFKNILNRICYMGFILITSQTVFADPPIFNNTLTLEQFGAITNTVTTLQPSSTLNIPSSPLLRTNDFQNLQLKYMSYGTNRPITRMGAFLISQAAQSSNPGFPAGPGVSFPDYVFVPPCPEPPGTCTQSNPAQSITVSTTSRQLIFSAAETANFNLTATVTPPPSTRQTDILHYANPANPAQYIEDYNVIGNAFHDILYHGLTPVIAAAASNLIQIRTSKETITNPSPPVGIVLEPANKFVLTFQNLQTLQLQTWILYLQPADNLTPDLPEITFTANFKNSSSIILSANQPFTGFIRAAIVQTDSVDFICQNSIGQPTQCNAPSEVADWSTGLEIQTIAPSPAALFMLWPTDFSTLARQKIEFNFACRNSIFLPYCPILSILIPVISAGRDIATANQYLKSLVAKIPPAPGQPFPFDGGTNQFLTYVYMQMAELYFNDIKCYQTDQRSFPNYGITATPETVESVYDNHRDVIPTLAEVAVGDGNYSWTYNTIIRSGSVQTQPLIIFPRYKRVSTSAVSGYLVNDPIKGVLYGTDAVNNKVTFNEANLPAFLTNEFFPKDFWSRLSSGGDIQTALDYFNQVLNNQLIPGNIRSIATAGDGYGNGKTLYMAGSTILYGASLMKQLGLSDAEIISKTKPVIDAIKFVFEQWLFSIQQQARLNPDFPTLSPPSPTPNFFIGDDLAHGINYSIRGMLGGSDAGIVGSDFGNAAYNDHHFAYGYWLGAAAAVIQWENQYGPVQNPPVATPWIAQSFISGTGQGPFKMKSYIDVLWRDTRNPDPNDPSLPFNRHGNIWEGHSTANGLNLSPYQAGRNQESLAEDFNSWLGTLFYAKAVLQTSTVYPNAFTQDDLKGFPTLVSFSETNLSMTATSGNLYYNTPNWPYARLGFNFNVVASNLFDALVDSNTFFGPGDPPCDVCTTNAAARKKKKEV
jgi:hypothetical protein